MGENARRALALAFAREDACERWRLMLEDVAERRKPEAWRVKPGLLGPRASGTVAERQRDEMEAGVPGVTQPAREKPDEVEAA